MDSLKASVWKLCVLQWGRNMAWDTGLSPPTNLLVDTMPHKTCCHHLLRGFHPRMCQTIDGIKDSTSPRGTNDGTCEVSHSKVVSVPGLEHTLVLINDLLTSLVFYRFSNSLTAGFLSLKNPAVRLYFFALILLLLKL